MCDLLNDRICLPDSAGHPQQDTMPRPNAPRSSGCRSRMIEGPGYGGSGPAALKQASNCRTIDRWCRPLEPIERGKPVIVPGRGIGAVIEKNLDGLHEACLGSVMQRRGSPAVVVLSGEALVVNTCAVTQERGDIKRIILSSLVPRAR